MHHIVRVERAGDYNQAAAALDRLFATLGPLPDWLPEGARVVIKPNWVLHENQAGEGLECMVTHPRVLEAIARQVSRARPSSLILGDAPVQACRFDVLRQACQLDDMAGRLRAQGIPIEIHDFRRTILRQHGDRVENAQDASRYVLFDLKSDSLLEEVSGGEFRVTMYNPDHLARTHAPGRHQYLIAREILDADVVINAPKLKTHKKACLTGALKNLVGINGNKEFLPHHRKGGSEGGGDCYPGRSWLKSLAENSLDRANRESAGSRRQQVLSRSGQILGRVAAYLGEDDNLEGAWHGNDTVWRMCLDLNRILRYGRPDGTLAGIPQRRIVSVTDAVVGGEREGPLASSPVQSGFISLATDAAAADWIHARLMGFDPRRIPLVRRAFDRMTHPVTDLSPEAIVLRLEGRDIPQASVFPLDGRPFQPASGWLGHCELREGEVAASSGERTVVA